MRIPTIRISSMAAALLLLAAMLGSSAVTAQDESPPTIEITGQDYAFVGLPSSVPVGTSFRFTNGGDEFHEMMIVRRNEGTTEPLDELLALPDEELGDKLTLVGGLFAPIGQTSPAQVTLGEEGDYIVVCFVSQGTTSSFAAPGEGDAPPHAALGMVGEFTVGGPDTAVGPLSTPVPAESE
jgi:plastocyanin